MTATETVTPSIAPPQMAGRFDLLVQSVTDYAIYMLDPTGVVMSWNAGAERFKGYSEAEIVGQHFSRFYTDADRATDLPARALRTARDEGRFEAEGWRVRKDGGHFWANVVIDPIRDGSGTLLGFAKVTRDLTDRRAADEALRLSEERFRMLVESVTDYAIYMLDPDGRVVSWNQGAQRFKGYTHDEIIGEHFSRFYGDEDRASGLPARALRQARDEGRFEAEGWRIRKDGTSFWANVVIDPIRDLNGELVGFAKITRDLTERRDSQRALEEAQQAFFQSQKMDALGKLTGGVAHDFNNLLAVVIGSLDLAKRRLAAGGEIGRFLDNAMQAAERGAALTQRMLAFARKQDLTLEIVDIGALVRGMADLLEHTLGTGISIETRFPLTLRSALADPRHLELALLNLAVNARDAMPAGGRIIISATERSVSGLACEGLVIGTYICLSVIDEGEGMDAETLARVTEPFFTTKGVGKGTGLGLSMVQGFAEQCGGQLELKSSKGEGTAATLWLPQADGAAGPADKLETADVRIPALTILAVDDDDLVLTNTAAMLEELGHRVIQASSGKHALEALHAQPIDLLITDYAMPEMTGAELIDAARRIWPWLPVLIATGNAELPTGTASDAPRLNKPFQQRQLALAVGTAAGHVEGH